MPFTRRTPIDKAVPDTTDEDAEVQGHGRRAPRPEGDQEELMPFGRRTPIGKAVPDETDEPEVEGHGRRAPKPEGAKMDGYVAEPADDSHAEVEGHMPFARRTPISKAVPNAVQQDEDDEVEGHAIKSGR